MVGANNNLNFQPQRDNYQENLRVENLAPPSDIPRAQTDARIDLLQGMEQDFVNRHPGLSPASHRTAYERAVRLMRTAAARAFNLEEESAQTRAAYGRNTFGQGCLLTRRLVERGVPFIEVSLGSFNSNALSWDTHQQNFTNVRALSQLLDPAWGTLMEDLRDRGMLESTLIVWTGEFGGTRRLSGQQPGRDHYPNAWTTVLAGGGIRGGRVVGRTSPDGTTIET